MWTPAISTFALLLAVFSFSANAQSTLTDDQIRAEIIKDSRNAYYATGHPCACPYDHARNGSTCGGRSAYSRPRGAEPKCYPKDVSKSEIDSYRKGRP